jgi:multiple sugar transport system permease protein
MNSARYPSIPVRFAAHLCVYTVSFTMLAPFLWMVASSLKSDAEALGAPVAILPRAWEWSNYAKAVRAAELHLFYWNSLVVAGVTTILGVLHNALAGFAFAKLRFSGKRVAFTLALATMMLPMQVCFIFAYIIASRLGYADTLRALIVPFLASGFGIYYMRQAIAAVPDSLLEAGRVDGMSDFELFLHVAVPAAWPAVNALAIFTFIASWNSFFWPLIVVDSKQMQTLPLAVAALASGRYVPSWPVQMAAVTILTLPLILVFLVFQRAFVRGLTMTGSKE